MEISRLRELFDYDAESGVIRWRKRPAADFASERMAKGWNKRFAGAAVGSLDESTGYLRLKIPRGLGEPPLRCMAHRACWAIATGAWPVWTIDHRDRDKANNRLENLRDVTQADQALNKGLHRNNTTGCAGVTMVRDRPKKPYRAQIGHQGKNFNLGSFATFAEAAKARAEAQAALGFDPDHGAAPPP